MLRTVTVAALAVVLAMPASARPTASGIERCLMEHELAHAGGWGPFHPGAVTRPGCGDLPMPPHPFPLRGVKVIIHRVSPGEVTAHCGLMASACTYFGNPAVMYFPNDGLRRRDR